MNAGLRNYLSYWAVEDYIYLGLRRPLKHFRKQLGLKPLRAIEGGCLCPILDRSAIMQLSSAHCGTRDLTSGQSSGILLALF